MSEKPCFRVPLEKQRGKCMETLLRSEWQHLYKICQSLLGWLHRERSLLLIHNILGLFVNNLTADNKHYLLNRLNLAQRIQMELSQKQKIIFVNFFLHF